MSGDIIQINLHKSMLAMVELNRHVKYAYNTDNVRTGAGGVDGSGVDVEGGRSSTRTYRNTDINRKNVRIGAVDGDGPVDVDGGRSSSRDIDKNRKKEQNWSNNDDGGVARAPDGHGGGRGSPTRGGDERGVGGRGWVRPDGWDHLKPRGRAEIGLFNYINDNSIYERDAVHNDIIADIDGVDRAEAAHGGVYTDLMDGAARLGVGSRGRPGLAGEPRHRYRLHKDKNEHNISNRGNIMHNIHVADDIDGVDQAPVAHGDDGVELVDGAARLEVGGRGRGRPGGLAGELRLLFAPSPSR